jgi:hypothetical protein
MDAVRWACVSGTFGNDSLAVLVAAVATAAER